MTSSNKWRSKCMAMAIAVFSLAACWQSPSSELTERNQISAIRLERTSNWVPDREAFVVRKDGSGFYELYEITDVGEKWAHKTKKRVDFGQGYKNFDEIVSKVKYLHQYTGDDSMRSLLNEPQFRGKLKKFLQCGHRATDAGSLAIWWDDLDPKTMENPDNFHKFFVIDQGCQSKDAEIAKVGIRNAITAFDELPLSELR